MDEEIRELKKENRTDHMKYMEGMEVLESDILEQVVARMEAYDYEKYTAKDVKAALSHTECTVEDFEALLSPAALPFLEEMAQRAKRRPESILGIRFICLLRYILLIIVKIFVFIVDLTAIIR